MKFRILILLLNTSTFYNFVADNLLDHHVSHHQCTSTNIDFLTPPLCRTSSLHVFTSNCYIICCMHEVQYFLLILILTAQTNAYGVTSPNDQVVASSLGKSVFITHTSLRFSILLLQYM